MFARQRESPVFSLWLTARTTDCPATLKKVASQSKSLLNDRVRSLFGGSPDPLLSSGRQLPPLLLLPAPRRFLPLSRQPFSPLAPLVFSTARFRRVFSVFLYAGVIGGLCRRAALPVRALPPADLFRPRAGFPIKQTTALAALCLQPRHEQILAHALCPDAYTPNGFVFRTTTPCDLFRPRAGTRAKQTRVSRRLRVFIMSLPLCQVSVPNKQELLVTLCF